MKSAIRLIVCSLALALIAAGCSIQENPIAASSSPNATTTAPAMRMFKGTTQIPSSIIANTVVPATAIQYPLTAGQMIPVGSVYVWNDATTLYVSYQATGGWSISETHLYVNTSAITSRLTPGKAPYAYSPNPKAVAVTFAIPKTWADGTDLFIQAHAVVCKSSGVSTASASSSYNDDDNKKGSKGKKDDEDDDRDETECGGGSVSTTCESAYGGTITKPSRGSWYGVIGYTIPRVITSMTISGIVYYDGNLNGVQDAGEQGLINVAVFLDDNNVAYTDDQGRYTFPGIPAGTYTLSVIEFPGSIYTTPQVTTVNLTADQTINFGIWITPL